MNTDIKPILTSLSHKKYRQVTYGKHLTLWELSPWKYSGSYSIVERLMLRLKKSEIAVTTEAVTMIMSQMIMGTIGNCEVTPEDGEFFTITWPIDTGSIHDDTPPFIYQFLKEYALISPKHKQEVRELREYIYSNFPLPF